MSDNDDRALVVSQPLAPTINLNEMMTIGKILASSGFFADTRSEAQAVAKILAGAEAGFGPMAAMTGIHIVKGKIVMGANLMAAKVKGSGRYNYKIKRLDDTGCVLEFFENGRPVGESSFTLEDAKKAGLGGGDNWQHYPRNMMFARAISNGVRWYCADVFNGTTVYTPEEMGDDKLPEMAVVEDVSEPLPPQNNGHTKPETKPRPTPPAPAKTVNERPTLADMESALGDEPPAHAQPVNRKLPEPVAPEIHNGVIYIHNALCPPECGQAMWTKWCELVAEATAAKIPLWEFEPMTTATVLYMGTQVRARLDTLKATLASEARS